MELSKKDVKKLKEIKETIETDETYGDETYGSAIHNLDETAHLMEILIWGCWFMNTQGVLNEEHQKAVVSYWQLEFWPKISKARGVMEKISQLDIEL